MRVGGGLDGFDFPTCCIVAGGNERIWMDGVDVLCRGERRLRVGGCSSTYGRGRERRGKVGMFE